MKTFTRIETIVQEVGEKFKQQVVIKRYATEDGLRHEFTTFFSEQLVSSPVVALTDDDKVVLVYQFRAGPDRWMYEFPSGGSLEGESSIESAARELAEETGYVPRTMEYLGTCYEGPYVNASNEVFFAQGCAPQNATHLDDTEAGQGMTTKLVTVEELLTLAKQGELCSNGPLVLAFDRLQAIQNVLQST